MFLEKQSDSLEVYNVSLLGYVCMTNHFHLLVMAPPGICRASYVISILPTPHLITAATTDPGICIRGVISPI